MFAIVNALFLSNRAGNMTYLKRYLQHGLQVVSKQLALWKVCTGDWLLFVIGLCLYHSRYLLARALQYLSLLWSRPSHTCYEVIHFSNFLFSWLMATICNIGTERLFWELSSTYVLLVPHTRTLHHDERVRVQEQGSSNIEKVKEWFFFSSTQFAALPSAMAAFSSKLPSSLVVLVAVPRLLWACFALFTAATSASSYLRGGGEREQWIRNT